MCPRCCCATWRVSYLQGLAAADRGQYTPLANLVGRAVEQRLDRYAGDAPIPTSLMLRGEPLGTAPAMGIVVALVGVVLVSVQPPMVAAGPSAGRAALPLALGAALNFGFFFACLDGGAGESGTTALWTVAGARLSSLPT